MSRENYQALPDIKLNHFLMLCVIFALLIDITLILKNI